MQRRNTKARFGNEAGLSVGGLNTPVTRRPLARRY
jgi:hypothetical protein